MSRVIQFLKMHAEDMRRQSKPNANTITQYQATENARMASECEFAAETLRLVYNQLFSDGVMEGVKNLAESMKG